MDFAVPVDHKVKIKENEKISPENLERKKVVVYESNGYTNCN